MQAVERNHLDLEAPRFEASVSHQLVDVPAVRGRHLVGVQTEVTRELLQL